MPPGAWRSQAGTFVDPVPGEIPFLQGPPPARWPAAKSQEPGRPVGMDLDDSQAANVFATVAMSVLDGVWSPAGGQEGICHANPV